MRVANKSINEILREALNQIKDEHGVVINELNVNWIGVRNGIDVEYMAESINIDSTIVKVN